MAEDMLRADPRLRVQTAIALVAATIVALIALFGFQSWLENIGQLPGNHIRQPQHQHFPVGIDFQLHQRISRQRRPSRCISINASSGPEDPGS